MESGAEWMGVCNTHLGSTSGPLAFDCDECGAVWTLTGLDGGRSVVVEVARSVQGCETCFAHRAFIAGASVLFRGSVVDYVRR